jgi:hypothetical protein
MAKIYPTLVSSLLSYSLTHYFPTHLLTPYLLTDELPTSDLTGGKILSTSFRALLTRLVLEPVPEEPDLVSDGDSENVDCLNTILLKKEKRSLVINRDQDKGEGDEDRSGYSHHAAFI